jgi:hypothetical protein
VERNVLPASSRHGILWWRRKISLHQSIRWQVVRVLICLNDWCSRFVWNVILFTKLKYDTVLWSTIEAIVSSETSTYLYKIGAAVSYERLPLIYPDVGGSRFLWNVVKFLTVHQNITILICANNWGCRLLWKRRCILPDDTRHSYLHSASTQWQMLVPLQCYQAVCIFPKNQDVFFVPAAPHTTVLTSHPRPVAATPPTLYSTVFL